MGYLTGILTAACVLYMSHTGYHFYKLFTVDTCRPDAADCLLPTFEPNPSGLFPLMQLRIYTSTSARQLGILAATFGNFQLADPFLRKINLTLPNETLRNGSLYAHCFLLPYEYDGENPYSASWVVSVSDKITEYQEPVSEAFNLVGETKTKDKKKTTASGKPVTHLRSILPLLGASEAPHFVKGKGVPAEIRHLLAVEQSKYLPILYMDRMSFRIKDLVEVKKTEPTMEITVDYRPTSVGKMRFLISTLMSFEQIKMMGFSDKDVDEVKGVFVDTNFYLLVVTVFVSAIHILFDLLSFKNDISFWQNRKNMVGLSTKALLWRCFSYTVIFFYLFDQETSLLVLIPSGISVVIEYWKVTKAFKISFSFSGGFKFGSQSAAEAETDAIDSQAMRYLSWVLAPLCIGGAVYSLVYVPHKSWRGWLLQSMANGVYAFGFLFMLPQLFVNYKLKSVAHLPWRAFMYKAFNTFIDDLFAFIITMPTAHRVACFRDDIVFLIYLYQRYLYPVDYSRVNEFGETGEDVAADKTEQEKKDD